MALCAPFVAIYAPRLTVLFATRASLLPSLYPGHD
jgi:hypothetical protein